MKEENKKLLIIAICYLIFVLLLISKYNFNPSSTLLLARPYLPGFSGTLPSGLVVHEQTGFDGQYYYMMALNPTLERINISPHFEQRIIYPILTIVLSLGVEELYPFTMLAINYFCVLLSCYILLLLLKKYNANLNLVYLFAFNVGFLLSISRDLTELLMMVFVAAGIYYLLHEKHKTGSLFFALALLTRELVLPLYGAVLLWFLIKKDFKNFAVYSLAIIPFLGWEIILYCQTGAIPILISYQSISKPIEGILDYLLKIRYNIFTYIQKPIAVNTSNILKCSAAASKPVAASGSATASTCGLVQKWSFNLFTMDDLRTINKVFSPLPIAIISILQLIVASVLYIKNKYVTKNSLFLFSQAALILSLTKNFFGDLEIDAVGRYAILLFFFAIIFYAEEKQKFGKYLKIISLICMILAITSSILYFLQTIVFLHPIYYIS